MPLTLHFHPLSSFCMKALVGLYELDISFTKRIVDLADPAERASFLELWPMGRFPVLRDEERALTVPESSMVLEYIDRDHRLVPRDRERARVCRTRDRLFDLYVNAPMQKIVTNELRPEGQRDPFGVAEAKKQLESAYDVAESFLAEEGDRWAAGETFTIADCAAAPALFYARKVVPTGSRKHLDAYYGRLEARPSFARVLSEAAPYLSMFPGKPV